MLPVFDTGAIAPAANSFAGIAYQPEPAGACVKAAGVEASSYAAATVSVSLEPTYQVIVHAPLTLIMPPLYGANLKTTAFAELVGKVNELLTATPREITSWELPCEVGNEVARVPTD